MHHLPVDANRVTALVVFVILAVFVLIRVFRIGRRPAGYPPGPPTIPLLGNIHQVASRHHSDSEMLLTGRRKMPRHDSHKQFQRWAQEYGPVYSLILGTKTLIVLSSDVAVKDLLDKRSAIYSDRPDMYIGMTLGSGGLRILMMVDLSIFFFQQCDEIAQFANISNTALRINLAYGRHLEKPFLKR